MVQACTRGKNFGGGDSVEKKIPELDGTEGSVGYKGSEVNRTVTDGEYETVRISVWSGGLGSGRDEFLRPSKDIFQLQQGYVVARLEKGPPETAETLRPVQLS